MSRTTVKDLEKELNLLKEEFKEHKIIFDTLANKYETLELQQKPRFKCSSCEEEFENQKDLKIHKRSKHSIIETSTFQCDQCEKSFDVEWKLNAH